MTCFKDQFPLFKNKPALVYLDSAATSQKPQEVIDAVTKYYTHECGTVHRAVYSLAAEATLHYNNVREKVRRFIHAKDESEIVFTRGTTTAINLVAFSFGEAFLQAGDEILVCETEHHANIVPWQNLCQRKQAVLQVLPVNDAGEICLESLERILQHGRVKLVAIAWIANATGVTHPIRQVISLAHRYGAVVLVDAAQAASHMSINVQLLDVDFLAFSGHKMYGPTGVGVLYGKKELLEQMPPYEGGGDMIHKVCFQQTTFQPPPVRFEAGTPSIAEVLGLGAAVDFLERVGFAEISSQEEALASYAQTLLQQIPGVSFLVPLKHPSTILSFSCEGCHPLDVGMMLDSRNICVRTGHLCAQPALARFGKTSVIRASFAIYNTKKDIDLFAEALKEISSLLRS